MLAGVFKIQNKKMEKDKGWLGEGVCRECTGKAGKGVRRAGLLLQIRMGVSNVSFAVGFLFYIR